jgi:hypothetical protein
MEWFRAGGWGMFVILAIGAASIGYGIKALQKPSAERLATLRALPALVFTSALFSFGTNLWAVNQHLSNEAFIKARGIASGDLPFVALIGVTEAAQALTLGGLLALIVATLRVFAERSCSKQAES